jgi:sulfite exporter TauE/SafE/copper chaperone CopZ
MQDGNDPARATDRQSQGVLQADISGMHCANCAVAVERRLMALPQVESVRVDYPSGQAVITHKGELDISTLQSALGSEGYGLSKAEDRKGFRHRHTSRDYLEIGAAFVVLTAVALALQNFHLLPRGLSVSDQMSYGLVFIIGLVASVSSCLAVTGGLLVALAAKYNETNPYLTDRQRLTPHLYFNAGRMISYTLLGGAIGALGSALTLSPAASGALTLLASLIMVLLGLNMLGLFPSIAAFLPRLPKSLSHKLHDAAALETKGTAFGLGAATFFLPCGFTQVLQLYVLSQASFATGALTMLAFALGTLPALLSLSAISSLARGGFQKHFLRFAGAAVILLGLMNIRYGLVLTGNDMNVATADTTKAADVVIGGVQTAEPQRISMKVVGLDYQPHQFTVKQGVPVQWWIDASQADGCGRVLVSPRLRIQKILSANSTTLISFTPDQPGDYAFNCGMGMMTPDSKITVVPNKG